MSNKIKKTTELIGKQSVHENIRQAKERKKILEIVFNSDEFERIWEKTSDNLKLLIIKDWGKSEFYGKKDDDNSDDKLCQMQKKIDELKKLLEKK